MGLFSNRHKAELKLGLGLHHTTALVSDVFQRCSDVNFFRALSHPVENRVDEHKGPRPANSVTALDDHRTGAAASVRLVHLPSELEDGLSGGGDRPLCPGEEVELGHRPCLPSLAVLEVE